MPVRNLDAPHSSIEVDSSIGNLFDKSMLYTAMWPMGAFVDTIQAAGYRGIEYLPLRGLLAGMQMNLGLVSQETKDTIVSAHQSYRSEKSWRQAWRHSKRLLAMSAYVVLPERVASLNDLERLQMVVGRELPVIMYPEMSGEERGTDRPFAEKIIQIVPEVWEYWGVKTPEQIIQGAEDRGYTGLCIDLFHLRGQSDSGAKLGKWEDILPTLLPHTSEIHISAGREDIQQTHIDTVQELKDLLKGNKNSEIFRMLKVVRDSGWTGRIVTEIPAEALKSVREKELGSSIRSLIDDHRRIIGSVQEALS
jgi:hypothetical protein